MMRTSPLIVAFYLIVQLSAATSFPAPASPPPGHDLWDQLLQQYVTDKGEVDYQGWQKQPAGLNRYLTILAGHPVQPDWPQAEKMAYWINVYNAFTVKLILDHYPVNSITDIHAGNPWDVEWIPLGDQTYSLNQIENDILRPHFNDPRIHFAINCAARSCPPLLNRAWTAEKLEQQLEQQTKAFINNPNFNQIKSSTVKISKIFEWYAVDFSNLTEFLNRYSNTRIRNDAKIEYLEYDWRLNNE